MPILFQYRVKYSSDEKALAGCPVVVSVMAIFRQSGRVLVPKEWRILCNESELIDSPEFCLIHVDPAHNARPHFHFRPPDFFSEINIGTRAVSPQAAASVGPLGKG